MFSITFLFIIQTTILFYNCIIAGQVGFAGSSTLGNNVMIGGQAGISGHLKAVEALRFHVHTH